MIELSIFRVRRRRKEEEEEKKKREKKKDEDGEEELLFMELAHGFLFCFEIDRNEKEENAAKMP